MILQPISVKELSKLVIAIAIEGVTLYLSKPLSSSAVRYIPLILSKSVACSLWNEGDLSLNEDRFFESGGIFIHPARRLISFAGQCATACLRWTLGLPPRTTSRHISTRARNTHDTRVFSSHLISAFRLFSFFQPFLSYIKNVFWRKS